MRIDPGQPIFAAVEWAQEWQRLSSTTINQAMAHCLHGSADVAMARTPQQALAALHRTQARLLAHSADAFAQVIGLWRKQNTPRLVMPAKHTPTPGFVDA